MSQILTKAIHIELHYFWSISYSVLRRVRHKSWM